MCRSVSLRDALKALVVLFAIGAGTARGATLDPDRVLDGSTRWAAGFTGCSVAVQAGSGSGAPGSGGNNVALGLTNSAALTALELIVRDTPDQLVATGCTSLVAGFDCGIVDDAGAVSVSLTSPTAALVPVHATNTAVAQLIYQVSALAESGVITLSPESVTAMGTGEQVCASTVGSGQFTVGVTDSDGDGVPDRDDGCPLDSNKIEPGVCGCGVPDTDTDGDGTANCIDECPDDPLKTEPGACGCGVPDTDTDGDGTPDCNDGCPDDPLKTEPGACGCGLPDTDTDGDGTADCIDGCPDDPLKSEPGDCGCGIPDTDTDGDGAADCIDGCPDDPLKTEAGACGCGVPDTDTDGDGTPNCNDGCPDDPTKTEPGACGCGVPDSDNDGDGTPDCNDGCPDDPERTEPGPCGCNARGDDTDTDGDGTADCIDGCPDDSLKTEPGDCGCGIPDTDTDGDGTPDCNDGCPDDPLKTEPGACGCGVPDTDTDGDGTPDCNDGCPDDPLKTEPGACGCGVPDNDTDGDGTPDCSDGCPDDPAKTEPGTCGCGIPDTDTDGDGTLDCNDGCPDDPERTEPGPCGCNSTEDDTDTDGDGTPDCLDDCPDDPLKTEPGDCGCGVPDTDTDGDGAADCIDGCPDDPLKTEPGACGCGVPDTDTDGDGTPDCNDGCPDDPAKTEPGACGCGLPDTDSDGDGTPDCDDGCPDDPAKTEPGLCGCNAPEDGTDSDGDGTPDCVDGCPDDPNRTEPGPCGCNAREDDTDTDGDGTPDCLDECPDDPLKTEPGDCGCGTPDTDTDGDGAADCIDECPDDPLKTEAGACGCGVPETDSDDDGDPDCTDPCPDDPQNDADGDGLCAGADNCPDVANTDQADLDIDGLGDACDPDADGDGVASPLDCDDLNAAISPNAAEICGNGIDEDCSGSDQACGGCEEVSRTGWSVTFVDSEELEGENGAKANAIDGDPLTHWVTRWVPESPGQPHEIRIDTGTLRVLCAFTYLPRQDGGVNGTIRDYEFAVSVDGVNWSTVSTGQLFTSTDSLVEQQVDFAPTPGRYVRLRSITEVNGGPWALVAELGLRGFGKGSSEPPIPTIDTPATDTSVDPGLSLEFAGSAFDPDGNVPLTFWWSFPDCAVPSVSYVEDPGTVVFACPSENYPVTLTVCDAAGACATTGRTITVTGPVCRPVRRGGWSVVSVDSEETIVEDGAGENAIDGDPLSHWVTQWSPVSPAHPHEIVVDTGSVRALCGFTYLPRQDGGVNGTIREYGFATSVDGENWTTVASGVLYDRTWGLVERQIAFEPTPGRYVRLRSFGAVENGPWAAVAELGVRGLTTPESLPPTAVIDAPADDVSIAPGDSVVFEGTGGDPDSELPLTYRWNFPACAVPSSSDAEDAGSVAFDCPAGVYPISFTVCDAAGLCQSAERIVTIVDGRCHDLSSAAWSVAYVDSEELVAEDGRATNAIDGDPSTMWVTQWVPNSSPVPHEIHLDLGTSGVLCGFTYLQRQDGGINGTIREYGFDVSDDGATWTQVAHGILTPKSSQIDFAPVAARYVRLRALSEINGGPWTTAAEIGVRGE